VTCTVKTQEAVKAKIFQKKKKKKGKGLEMNETPVGDRPVVAVECSMSCLESKSHGLRVKIVTPCTA
jgi:hypothetical protein